jgi:hypothetical protein
MDMLEVLSFLDYLDSYIQIVNFNPQGNTELSSHLCVVSHIWI